MSHLKRQFAPKSWPIPRKGTTFVIKPNFGLSKGIPLLIVLRDMLKIVQNRKEAKKAIHFKNIFVNGREAKDEKDGILLFDVITIVPSKKNYKLSVSLKGKFELEEIKEVESNHKISKVIGKKILKGKKVQLNLSDGRNFLSDAKCKTNDSVLIDFKNNKIEKCLPLKEDSNVFVFAGKHSGAIGKIEKINKERKMATIESHQEKINILIKQFMVIE
jgi:small subunit ribosomal protein S4e